MDQTLNLVFINSWHWLNIASFIKTLHEKANEKCYIVILSSIYMKDLTKSSSQRLDLVHLSQLALFLATGSYSSVNCILHHHEKSVDLYKIIYPLLINSFHRVNISFYADGYTNYFLHGSKIKYIIDNTLQEHFLYFYTFGLLRSYNTPDHALFQHMLIDSSIIKKTFTDSNLASIYSLFAPNHSWLLEKDNISVILLRPWASDSFNRGLLAGDKQSFISSIVSSIAENLSSNTSLLIRPDFRDRDLTCSIADDLVLHLRDIGLNAEVFGRNHWPVYFTFDYMMFLLATKSMEGVVSSFTFDSTSFVPFLLSNGSGSSYLGLDRAGLESIFSGIHLENILKKIRQLRRLYENYQIQNPAIRIIDYSDTFFKVLIDS